MKWLRITSQIVAVAGGVMLLVFLTPQSGWRVLNVATGSMRPAIEPGSLAIVQRVPQSALKVGDVVTYLALGARGGETITHRISAIETREGARRLTTKGDANARADRPFAAGRVVGRVLVTVPGLGGLAQSLRAPWLAFLVVVLPALWVIVAEMRTLWLIWREPAALQPEATAPMVRRPVRTLDGLRRMGMVVIGISFILGIHSTMALLNDKTALTGNTIRTAPATPSPSAAPSPSPSASLVPGGDCADVHIGPTAPGSVNQVTCTSTNIRVINGASSVKVTHSSTQTTTVGGH